jgi:hypothetical protein
VSTGLLLFVVPCGRNKLDRPAPARQLYSSAHFGYTLRQVEAEAARAGGVVRVLSALHGLIDPDQELAPYDVTMICDERISPHALAVQLRDLGRTIEVRAFLPAVYLAALLEAAFTAEREHLATVTVVNAYADAPGIGHQRHVLAQLGPGLLNPHHLNPTRGRTTMTDIPDDEQKPVVTQATVPVPMESGTAIISAANAAELVRIFGDPTDAVRDVHVKINTQGRVAISWIDGQWWIAEPESHLAGPFDTAQLAAHSTDWTVLTPGPAHPILNSHTRDMIHRCRLAKNTNDGHPYGSWSSGERLFVALVLHDQETLDAERYTEDEVIDRFRYESWTPYDRGAFLSWLEAIRVEVDHPGFVTGETTA